MKKPVSISMALALGLLALPNPALPADPPPVVVRPLVVGGSPPRGFMNSVRVVHSHAEAATGALETRTLRLAISENLPQGAGEDLRGSFWLAAATAGRACGDPLFDHSFTVTVDGMVDGASAGGLLTVGMLAALRGQAVLPDSTMTGTILPDGGIGIVGGVRHKLDAAKAGGMRKVVLPSTLRMDRDIETGQFVDLATHAEKLGLELAFVSSLEEAYFELTGSLLTPPSRQPSTRGQITLPAEVSKALRAKVQDRYREADTSVQDLLENPGMEHLTKLSELVRAAVREVFKQTLADADNQQARAQAFMRGGQLVAAHDRLTASLVAINAIRSWRDQKYALADDAALNEFFNTQLAAVLDRKRSVGATRTNAVESSLLGARAARDHLDMTSPLRVMATRQTLLADASAQQGARPKTFLQHVFGTTEERDLEYARILEHSRKTLHAHRCAVVRQMLDRTDPGAATVDADVLVPALAFRGDSQRPPRPLNAVRTEQWARFIETRHTAVLASLRSILMRVPAEQQLSMALDPVARRALALNEFLLSQHDAAKGAAPVKVETTAEKWFLQAAFFALEETEMVSYMSRLELGQQGADGGQGYSFSLQGGELRGMLDRAEMTARQAILAAERAGYEAVGQRYDYLLAEGLKDGGAEEQFKALRLYWAAGALCQLVDLCTQP
jgi:bifunctional DNA-binding transcriptional regulator/antitoxin component of YhaV-PrlF toxin-antitoxin module